MKALMVVLAACALAHVPGSSVLRAQTTATPAAAQAKKPKPSATQKALRAEVEALNAAMVDAYKRKDPIAIAAFYTDDAQVITPRGVSAAGRAALNRYWQSLPPSGTWALEVREVGGTHDLVYEYGHSLLISGSMRSAGDWIGIWKRQADGSLKLAVDYFVPAPRQPAP